MFKDFFNYLRPVDETDDPHLSLTLGTGKGVGLIDLSDEVGPVLFFSFETGGGSTSMTSGFQVTVSSP